MTLIGNSLFMWLYELLFPKRCVGCSQTGEWLCHRCKSPLMVGVDTKNNDGSVGTYLDGLWAVADYKNPLIKKIIGLIKYNFAIEIAAILEDLLKSYYSRHPDLASQAVLVPVPLHRHRFLWRGFNQAELICNLLKKISGHNINNNILKRKINNQPQAKLKADKREKNVSGVFEVSVGISIPETILLVDDVYTTGSTMQECARVLKNAGCKRVGGLVIARG